MKNLKLYKIDLLSWLSFALILAIGVLESESPRGVILSWGYILCVLLTAKSNNKRDIIISVLLSLLFVGFSFFRPGNDVEFKAILLNRAYALIGVGLTGYFVLRFIRRETKSRDERTLMAGIFSHGTQGIILYKSTGVIVMVNPYAEKMFGLKQNKLSISTIQSLIPEIYSIEEAMSQTPSMPNHEVRRDIIALRGDGTEFPVEISLNQYESGNEKYIVTFLTDITQRKQNEEILLAQKNELEIVNRQLEAFSYSVSHDLRAPLRAVGGYAEMLVEDYGEKLDSEASRLLSNIQKNAARMGTLIDDLLTFSRLGRKEIRKSKVNITRLVHTILDEFNLPSNNQAQFVVHNLHSVMADASLINQVLSNVLSNAIKYSSKNDHPHIEISSTEEDGYIIYCVRDNGVGFDMNYVNKLFGVFQRLHSDNEFEGTGVGLAIAQRIIQKHGGNIWAVGKEGDGAAFYFSLPTLADSSFTDQIIQNEIAISQAEMPEQTYKVG